MEQAHNFSDVWINKHCAQRQNTGLNYVLGNNREKVFHLH